MISNARLAAMLLASIALCSCSGSQDQSNSGPEKPGSSTPPALKKVRVRLSWLPSAEYAGLIAAVHNGDYKKQGLDVQLETGGVGFPPVQLVASGADEFGLVGGDTLLLARSQGVPVRSFATEFQTTPQVFFARASTGIKSPSQFAGHTVGIKVGKTAETLFKALVGKVGLDPSTVTTVPVRAGMQEFFAGKVDVWPGFIFDEAEDAKAHGIPINVIEPSKFGIQLYSDVLFASDQTLQKEPDLAAKFLKGTQAGWKWVSDHPDEALKLVMKDYPSLNAAHEKIRLEGTLPRVVGEPGKRVEPMGRMDAAVWNSMYRMLEEQHLLRKSFPVTDAYTLDIAK